MEAKAQATIESSSRSAKRFKLVMLGETSTGKTSLALRFSKRIFHEWQESTIGAAYLTGNVTLDAQTLTFEIWDTAGQERYHSLAPMYYRGARAALVLYDITNAPSYERAREWIAELRKDGPVEIVIALVGNKVDLGSKREVDESEAKEWAESQHVLFMETSAKSGFCVDQVFESVAMKLLPSSAAISNVNGPMGNGGQGVNLNTVNNNDDAMAGRCC